MTNIPMDNPAPEREPAPNAAEPPRPQTPPRAWRDRASLAIQLALSLAVAIGILAYLRWGGGHASGPDEGEHASRPAEPVSVASARSIRVQPGTALDRELHVAEARSAWLTSPILPVTGAVLASLRPGKEVAHDAWQFATPDLLNAFSDWQKAVVDIQYQETQLKAIRDLNESRMAAQKEVVARMEKLVAAGTDTQKDLVAERTNLIQFEIQGRKDIRDQEEAVAGSPADRGHAVAAASAGRPGADHAPLRRRRGRHRGRGSAGKAHGHREARHDVRGAFLRPARRRCSTARCRAYRR